MSGLADMQELLGDFLAEAGDLLDDVDRRLVELEKSPQDAELLNTVFRGFHTIKGGAGFLDATALVDLCHRTENVFDRLRSGKMALSAELMDTILAATGEVRRMFGEMSGGAMPAPAEQGILDALAAALEGRAPVAQPAATATAAVAAPRSVAGAAGQPATEGSPGGLDWQKLYEALVPSAAPPRPPPTRRPARSPRPGRRLRPSPRPRLRSRIRSVSTPHASTRSSTCRGRSA